MSRAGRTASSSKPSLACGCCRSTPAFGGANKNPSKMLATTFLLEVMDKEPTIIRVWTQFLFLGIIGFAICRIRIKAVYVVIPVIAFFTYFWYSELNDPQVGQDIRAEAGYSYVYQSYVAMAFALAAPIIGAFIKWKRIRT